MKNRQFVTIALLSMSLIALEIVWTRIFSAEFFYTFAFLILSLAVAGLGLGALIFKLLPRFNQPSNLGVFLSLAAFFTVIAPPLVFLINIDFSTLFNSWLMVGKLLIIILLLSSAFLAGGICLAFLFKNFHNQMPRLYMADLLGAGAGVLMAVLLMNIWGTPTATFLAPIPVLLSAFYSSRRWMKIPVLLIFILSLVMLGSADSLLEAQRDERWPVIHKHWDAMAKVKIYDSGDEYRQLNIDNVAHTGTIRFDGNWDRPDSLKFEFSIDVSALIQQFDSCTYLVIGAGGGVDVVQPLQASVPEVHAVEVIPYLNYLLLDGQLAEYSGYIYRDPRVRVITEDARAYVRRFHNKFDLMYSSSSNTFAALASGAFALAENYLFTTEAFRDYWLALSDSGYLVMEHQVYMPRIVSQLMDALQELQITDIHSHFAVYDWPQARRNILLLSRRPLTPEIINHAITGRAGLEHSPFVPLYPPADSVENNIINQIVTHGWKAVADTAKIDISPCTDNRPFIAQMGTWRNFQWRKLEKVIPYSDFYGFPLSRIIIYIILAAVLIFIIPLNLIPYFLKGPKLKGFPWLYFFIIGMAFMSIEVILIQKYTLFIGPSVYSIITVLLTLLVCSAIGSRFSDKVDASVTFGGIVAWLILDSLVFGHLLSHLGHLSLLPRILISTALISPLSFFMGMPFPKGTLRVGELIDWGFAVNGAASVLGSTLIILVAFSWGFTVSLLAGAALYFFAYVLIKWESVW